VEAAGATMDGTTGQAPSTHVADESSRSAEKQRHLKKRQKRELRKNEPAS